MPEKLTAEVGQLGDILPGAVDADGRQVDGVLCRGDGPVEEGPPGIPGGWDKRGGRGTPTREGGYRRGDYLREECSREYRTGPRTARVLTSR